MLDTDHAAAAEHGFGLSLMPPHSQEEVVNKAHDPKLDAPLRFGAHNGECKTVETQEESTRKEHDTSSLSKISNVFFNHIVRSLM